MWYPGFLLGIIVQVIGTNLFYKGKIKKDDSEEKKKRKKRFTKMGITILVIGWLLILFSLSLVFFT
jgi:uncharacterized membrane protein